ncbi:MAG: metal-dependent transcriptional regulator [Fusicatenibacter sp.]
MQLRESGEMYLETIHILSQKNAFVRAIDVGKYTGYSKPSVNRALGILKQQGYITVDVDGYISLTDAGREIAATIYERHTILSDLLMRLNVDEETAVADACRIEHVISDKSFQAIKDYVVK